MALGVDPRHPLLLELTKKVVNWLQSARPAEQRIEHTEPQLQSLAEAVAPLLHPLRALYLQELICSVFDLPEANRQSVVRAVVELLPADSSAISIIVLVAALKPYTAAGLQSFVAWAKQFIVQGDFESCRWEALFVAAATSAEKRTDLLFYSQALMASLTELAGGYQRIAGILLSTTPQRWSQTVECTQLILGQQFKYELNEAMGVLQVVAGFEAFEQRSFAVQINHLRADADCVDAPLECVSALLRIPVEQRSRMVDLTRRCCGTTQHGWARAAMLDQVRMSLSDKPYAEQESIVAALRTCQVNPEYVEEWTLLLDTLSRLPEAERDSFPGQLALLSQFGSLQLQVGRIVYALETVPHAQRPDFVVLADRLRTLCLPRPHGVDLYEGSLLHLADLPGGHEGRDAYMDEVETTEGAGLAQWDDSDSETDGVDRENVMFRASQRTVNGAIEALQSELGLVPEECRTLVRDIALHIEFLQSRPKKLPGALGRWRAGGTEIENAARTLTGELEADDFSSCVQDTPESAAVCAAVWYKILLLAQSGAVRLADRELMQYSMLMALAQCIEDDGHRVCDVGLRARAIRVLQGYSPEFTVDGLKESPTQLLLQLARTFASEYGVDEEPDTAALQEFVRTAQAEAEPLYGVHTPERQLFEESLREYMRLSYDFRIL
jgi:hypothetical protein